MFPLQSQIDGLEFDQDPLFSDQQDKILEDLLADYAVLEDNQVTDKVINKMQIEASTSGADGIQELKKSMRRDIERQRRQEMSSLYASLRSLLPLEYVKGKRAISDQVHQAVNYIKHMQKKIEEMQIRRDKLKTLTNSAEDATEAAIPSSSISDSPHNCVKVNLCSDGVEILISSESVLLSQVLAYLLERGYNVISCISSRLDEWFLYQIQIELNDPTTSIDQTKLKEGLVLNFGSSCMNHPGKV